MAKQSRLQNSPRILGSRRKQKSIADIMERDKDSQAKTKDKKISKKGGKSSHAKTKSKEITGKPTTLSGKKKRKGREESDGEVDSNLTSETGRGRKSRSSGSPVSADIKVAQTGKKKGSVVKEGTKKGHISSRRKSDAVGSEHDVEGRIQTAELTVSNNKKLKLQSLQRNDSEVKGRIEKGILSRERKKSKYLSPPFMNIISGKRKRETELETPQVFNEAQIEERIPGAAHHLIGSPQIASCSTEKHLKDLSVELPGSNQETSHGSSLKTKTDDQKEIMDPTKANVAVNEVLSQIRSVAVNPLNLRRMKVFEVEGFIFNFRNSTYCNGSNYNLYNKCQCQSKRKILGYESDMPGNDSKQTLKTLPENELELRRTRNNQYKKADKTVDTKLGRRTRKSEDEKADKHRQKEEMETLDAELDRRKRKQVSGTLDSKERGKQGGGTPDLKKKPKQCGGTPDSKKKDKKTKEEASPTVLFVTFGPGSSLPTKVDLIRIYSKYGNLNETETEMFYDNFCARVSFIDSSDAEKAFVHSQNANPFGSANITFRLIYLDSASKTGKLNEISCKKASPPHNRPRDKTPKNKSTSQQSSVDASELNFIKQKLEMLTLMLEKSGKKVPPRMKSKLEGEMKGLLEKVNTMVTTSSKIG